MTENELARGLTREQRLVQAGIDAVEKLNRSSFYNRPLQESEVEALINAGHDVTGLRFYPSNDERYQIEIVTGVARRSTGELILATRDAGATE